MRGWRSWQEGSLKRALWLILGLALALLAWNGIGSPREAMASPSEGSRILTVTGQGSVSVENSLALIRLGVVIQGNSAQAVQQQVAERSERLVNRLKELQVSALQTTGISLYPQYDYQQSPPRLTGVQGQNSLQFEVPIARAGQVLDEAVSAGATQVESVSFRADEATLLQARSRALRQAVEDAQRQAQEVLGVLNLSSRSVERIQIHSDGYFLPPPAPLNVRTDYARLEAATTPVEGGQQTVRAQVTLEIRY